MATHLSLHSLVFFLGILIFAAADDLVLPALTLQTGPNDLPQQPQANNTVPADVSRSESPQTHDFQEAQDNFDEENDSSKPGTLGEGGGLLDLPVAVISSNLTSQPVVSVATSESPQEQDTEPSNKDISNSEVIIGANSGQPKNSVTIDNEDGGQLGQNNETEISDSNRTLNDFHGKNVTANSSQWDKLPVPPFDALHLTDLTENGNLERFIHNETVDVTTTEFDYTSAGIKDSDLLQTEGLNESSSSNQSYQEHVHGSSQYSLQHLLQQQKRLLSPQLQPQKQSYNQTDTALLPESHSQLGNQQNVHIEHAELPLPPTYNAELPVGKESLPHQYHQQQQHQELKGQPLELPKLPVYQDSPKEQQLQEQKEQLIELPKPPLHQYSPKEQQQQQQQPLELPKPPLYLYGRKEQQPQQQQQQPLELPKPPLYLYGRKEQQPQQQQQPLELPKPPLYLYGRKEQQPQQQQPLELPKPPLYLYGRKEQQPQQQQPLELPKPPLYLYGRKEQQPQQQQQPLELPKPPLYLYGRKEEQQQQQQQQLLELPTPPLYRNGSKEQQQQIPQQQQPLALPNTPLDPYDPKKQQQLILQLQQQLLQQQQKLDSLELLKSQYQYGTTEKQQPQQQPIELPKLPLYPFGVKEQPQQQQKPLELPKPPLYTYGVKEQQKPLELPKPPLYTYGVKEQQKPLELPKPPLYPYGVKEQPQQQQKPLELPKPPLYPYGVKEQQKPLELPKPPLYPYGVKEQQKPLELPKLPVYQYNPQQQNQKEQALELPKLSPNGDTQEEQTPQPQENKYGQAELSQVPNEVAKLAGDIHKLPEHSQANGATSNDKGDSTDYSETGGSMMSSDENEYQSNYEPPVSPLGKQEDTDYRQKSKWKSAYKVNNKGQDELYKEGTNDEGYYDDDSKGGELNNNNREGDKANSDDGYVNQESTYSDEEDLDNTKKTHADDDESGTLWDVDNSEDDDRDVDNSEDDDRDVNNSDKMHLVEDVVDEDLASRSRLPTAPTSMVVFYTWMIVAILIFVVGISMYQSHCHGFRFRLPGSKSSSSGSDRKRLLDHEFV